IGRLVSEVDPTLPVFDARAMTTAVAAATAQLSFIILILASAAAVSLVLGAVGLYGVLAYVVTLRSRELAIRVALGAAPARVATAMMRHGLGLTGTGVVIGLAIFAF